MTTSNDYLKTKEVQEEYGYSRSSLLRYESDGLIHPSYSPGGQRRYLRADIERLRINPSEAQAAETMPYREFGSAGFSKWASKPYDEKFRELRGRAGLSLYREMRLNDPVISAIFTAIENALRRPTWRVSPVSQAEGDIQSAEFVNQNMEDMSWSWSDTLSFVLQCLEQGYSVLEVIYKKRLGENPPPYVADPGQSLYNDNRVGWRKWAPRPAETLVENDEFIIDKHGSIQGINQEQPDRSIVQIPIKRLLHFRTTVIPANSPKGLPIHRSMFIPWWYSQNIMEIEGIGFERDLAGIPVIYMGDGTTKSGPNSDFEMAKQLVTNIRNDEQTGIVFPQPKLGTTNDGNGILLELLSSSGRRQYDTNAILERYDKRKALAVLAQFIMLGMEQVGSFALSKSQGDLFILSVSSWLSSIADIINRHAVPRLMKYNVFPGMTGMPKLVPSTVGIPDLASISMFVNQLVNQDVLTPDIELERHLRQIAGLPEIPIEINSATGEAGVGKQSLSLEKAALLVRRVGLATRALTDLNVIDSNQAVELMTPLVQELQDGIQNELLAGGSIKRQKRVSSATQQEQQQEDEEDQPIPPQPIRKPKQNPK